MKKSLLLGLAGLLLLVACGQTGPLYLPDTGAEHSGEETQGRTE